MSLRARILMLVLIVLLAPAAVLAFFLARDRAADVAEAQRQLAVTVQSIADDMGDVVRATAQLHYGLSRAGDLDTRDRAACSGFLADVLGEFPQYTGILTIRPDGSLFCDSLKSGRNLDLNDRRYFRAAMSARSPLAVEPAFGRLTGIAVLQIAYGVRDRQGATKQVLLASLNLEKYMENRQRNLPFAQAVLALVDEKGALLTWHPGGEKLRGTSVAGSELHRLALAAGTGLASAEVQFGGDARIWKAAALPGFAEAGLTVLLGVPSASLSANADQRLGRTLAILAAVLLIAFAAGWSLAELGIRRPAMRIAAAVARFHSGDLAGRIGAPYPKGELGDLMSGIDAAAARLQAQGDEIRALNASLDQRVRERTVQLEAANREIEAFAYSVSHDLRAPLRSIDGFSQVLLVDYGTKLDDEGKDHLRRVRAAAQRMAGLIDDMLKLSHVSRGELAIEAVDLSAIARAVAGELRDSQPARAVEVSVADGVSVRGDARLLRAVMENLLSNAWKFTGKTDAARIEFAAQERDGELVCRVSDNGAGFDMAFAGGLFSPFQRLHQTAEFPGNGIGLATVKRIISRLGGRVWAEGARGKGATFYFTLPTVCVLTQPKTTAARSSRS